MKNLTDIKKNLDLIIENCDCGVPACKRCESYKNGGCSFGCLNERVKITSPNYSCENFNAVYKFSEGTLDVIKDIKRNLERLDEDLVNLDLFLSGKINEDEFNDIVK